jgi:hypothetical protein
MLCVTGEQHGMHGADMGRVSRMEVNATLRWQIVEERVMCLLSMTVPFRLYVWEGMNTQPTDLYRALGNGETYVQPFHLRKDDEAFVVVSKAQFGSVALNQWGLPVVESSMGITFTLEVMSKREGEQ